MITSCFGESSTMTPLQERGERKSSLGFSFIPPPGGGWFEDFKENTVSYLKKTDPQKYTFFTGATEYRTKMSFETPDKYLDFIKNKKSMGDSDNSPRFKNSQGHYELVPSLAPFCVRYKEHFEDHGANNLNGRKFMIVENFGLICLHPENPTVGVDIYYSERCAANEQNQTFRNEGEEFIKSLKFFPLENK
jgi:hypothetical protein